GAGAGGRQGRARMRPRPGGRRGRRTLLPAVIVVLAGAGAVVGPTGGPAGAVALTTNWIGLSPASSPPARTSAVMAFDPATGDTVLFGGDSIVDGSGALLADTWTWNGVTWTEQFPAVSPPARDGASMAYDAATGDMVLFGGLSADGDLADTWIWNGLTWSEAQPTKSPPARYASAMAYDAATQNIVLFGGLADRTMLSDTWSWNGEVWTQVSGGTRPAARDDAAMAYDSTNRTIVLFGGAGSSGALGDTWVWSGGGWSPASTAQSPSARFGESLADDPATGTVVLFGGYAGGQSDQSDMWTWNGALWSQIFPGTTPPARRFAGMAYDPTDGNLTLFGGDPGGVVPSSLGDTWIWGSEGTFTVTPFPSSIILGATEAVTANLTGKAGVGAPTGSISFFVCGPEAAASPCTSQAVPLGGPVTLTTGGGASSTAASGPFAPSGAGTWCIAASYTGDTNYAPAGDLTDGCFVVEPPVSVTPDQATVTAGSSDGAVATVDGTAADGVPTGTVSFYLCPSSDLPASCTTPSDLLGAPVAVTTGTGGNATASSPDTSPLAVGTWCIAATYSGDGSYAMASDTTSDGCITVTPNLKASASLPSIPLGATDTDIAAVTGNATGGVPTGTVTFYVCGPSSVPAGCTSQAVPVGPEATLVPGAGDAAAVSSAPFAPTSTGDWCFAADYAGGGAYGAQNDTTTDQCVVVTAVGPAVTSAASAATTARLPFTFTVTTTGSPAPALTATGLPRWLVLTDNGNGTATLSATRVRRGKHKIVLTATNSGGSATQTFVLTVGKKVAP
ncbi:MAG: Kelch repeat-containing protein, partial [Acidimicrobiales bacterium]